MLYKNWHRSGFRFDVAFPLVAANASAVSSLYLAQACISPLGSYFPDTSLVSMVPSGSFLGYATGLGLIIAGVDVRWAITPRKHIWLLVISLIAAATAPTVGALIAASFLVGCGASVAQRILAMAAQSARPRCQGAAVGQLIGAALLLLLCVRLGTQEIAHAFGWRSAFFLAASVVAVIAAYGVPAEVSGAPGTCSVRLNFGDLFRQHPLLKRIAAQQFALMCAWNGAWVTALAALSADEGRAPAIVGGGLAGVFAALLAGRLADRYPPGNLALAGALSVFVATGLILPSAYAASDPEARVLLLLLGSVLLDTGLQVALVANHVRAQMLQPSARSRLAAILTIGGFLGGSVGVGVSHWLWLTFGWPAAIGLSALAGVIAFILSVVDTSGHATHHIRQVNKRIVHYLAPRHLPRAK